jgi:hypothetical protein
MDIPLSGALFITNPRRNKRRMVTRDNGYKNTMLARELGVSKARVKAMKSRRKADGTPKSEAQYQKDQARLAAAFRAAGGEKALKKGVANRGKSRAAMKQVFERASKRRSSSKSARKNSAMKHNPRRKKSAWQRYLKAASGKGYSLAELRAGYKTLVRRHGSNVAKIVADAKKFKPKAGAVAKKRKSSKRKSASKAPARLGFSLSRVQRVVRKKNKNGVYQYFAVLGRSGTVMKRISKAAYNMLRAKGIGAKGRTLKKRKAAPKRRTTASKRRTTTRRKTTRRPASRSRARVSARRARKARPVGGLRKVRTPRGMRYMLDGKFISKAKYNSMLPRGLRVANPRRKRSGFGALALRKNTRMRKNAGVLGGALNLFDRSANMLARVPVVGRLAPIIPTLGLFGSAAAIHFYAMRYLGPKLPGLGERVGSFIGQGERGYNLGVLAQKGGYTIGGLAVGALILAGHRYLPKLFPSRVASSAFATAAVGLGFGYDVLDALRGQDASEASMDADFSGLAYTGGELNGLAYTGGELNGLAYTGGELNGVHLNGAHLNGAHMNGAHDLMESYAGAHFGDAMHSGPDFDTIEGQCLMMGPMAYKSRFGLPAARGFVNRSGMSAMAGKHGHRWGWLIKMIGFQRAAKLAALPPRKRMAIIAKLRAKAKMMIDQANYGALAYKGGNLNGAHMNGAHMNGLAYTGGGLNGLAYVGGPV